MKDDDQQPPTPSKGPHSSTDSGKRKNIMAILMRLSLHCPPRTMEPGQFKLVIEDMIEDLVGQGVYAIQQAAAAWRQSGEQFFPTSGQIIQEIEDGREASIARARASSPAYRQPQIDVERKWPYQHRPWRDILRQHGRPIPPDDSPFAKQLDSLQRTPVRELLKREGGRA